MPAWFRAPLPACLSALHRRDREQPPRTPSGHARRPLGSTRGRSGPSSYRVLTPARAFGSHDKSVIARLDYRKRPSATGTPCFAPALLPTTARTQPATLVHSRDSLKYIPNRDPAE